MPGQLETFSGLWGRLEVDTQRYDEFAEAGYVVLRFTWRQITGRPDWVVDMVRRTLKQRGWA